MLQRLSAMPFEDPQWGPAFAQLADAVSHHAKEEEDELFPAANRILGKDVTEHLKTCYLEKRKAIANANRRGPPQKASCRTSPQGEAAAMWPAGGSPPRRGGRESWRLACLA